MDRDELPDTPNKVMLGALLANTLLAIRRGIFPEMMRGMDDAGFGPVMRHVMRQHDRRSQGLPTDADEPMEISVAGWYDDPEVDGYLRWWSGSEWAGQPTLPEHVM